MAQLLPLRDELVRGDYRSLYIGWLSSIAGEPSEDEENGSGAADRREPPVPPGLGSLTGAQDALAKFLGVGIDLIAASASASPAILKPSVKGSSDELGQEIDRWVAQIAEANLRALIAHVIRGEGQRIQTELQSRFYRSQRESAPNSSPLPGEERRTAADLTALAAKMGRERQQREEAARTRKRHAHLAGLVPRFGELWATVNALADEKTGVSYDKACALLVDLHDAYVHANWRAEFDVAFARFLGQYGRSVALTRRLKEARLVS